MVSQFVVTGNNKSTDATGGPTAGDPTRSAIPTPTPDDIPPGSTLEGVTKGLPNTPQLVPLNTGDSPDANPNYAAEGNSDRRVATEMSTTSLFSNLFTDGRDFRPAESNFSLVM